MIKTETTTTDYACVPEYFNSDWTKGEEQVWHFSTHNAQTDFSHGFLNDFRSQTFHVAQAKTANKFVNG